MVRQLRQLPALRPRRIRVSAMTRVAGSRLESECSKLDKKFEQAMVDEGLGADAETWPEY